MLTGLRGAALSVWQREPTCVARFLPDRETQIRSQAIPAAIEFGVNCAAVLSPIQFGAKRTAGLLP